MTIVFKYLNWENSFVFSHLLFEKIFLDGYIPELIVAIARGGWIPGRMLADFFRTKDTANIKVEAYTKIGDDEINAKITQDINLNVKGKKILIVDDIADTGASLELVLNKMKERGAGEIRSATLYYKPRSTIKPDYYLRETGAWIIFPWEQYETIQELTKKFENEGLKHLEIRYKLLEIGLPVSMIDSYFAHYTQ